jgi:hypothetical protein
LCAATFNSFSQQTGAPTPQTVQRDPQALTILTQVLNNAGGGTALAAIQDFTGAGSITYYWAGEEVQGTVTVKGRGIGQFRLDATLPMGARSFVTNNGAGSMIEVDGRTMLIPSNQAVNIGSSIIFPLGQLLVAQKDISWSVSYLGIVTHDGSQVHEIRLQKISTDNNNPYSSKSKLTKTDFFIDPNTFLILSVQDKAYRKDGEPGDIIHEMQFSSYETSNGILVPFSITELIGGQQTAKIQLNQITFNSGLTDADFAQ